MEGLREIHTVSLFQLKKTGVVHGMREKSERIGKREDA